MTVTTVIYKQSNLFEPRQDFIECVWSASSIHGVSIKPLDINVAKLVELPSVIKIPSSSTNHGAVGFVARQVF